jgi:hypothetical protein
MKYTAAPGGEGVLLGLRQLPTLTPRADQRADGMSGVEMLVVARALRSAGEVLGGGETGVSIARAMLNSLVLPASVDQPPKAQRQPFAKLVEIAGSPERATRALQILQAEEIVRPAWSGAPEGAWQLDHDYLARAVLAEMRRADRSGTALDEGFARYRAAKGSFRRQWAVLLPITVQARLFWENRRGRLHYGQAVGYARASRRMLFEDAERPMLKPLPAEPYVYAEWKQCRVGVDGRRLCRAAIAGQRA